MSYVPWLYDEEVVAHARDMTSLHARYADTIIRLARQTVEDGTPICRPVGRQRHFCQMLPEDYDGRCGGWTRRTPPPLL